MALPDDLVDPFAATVCRVLETPYPYAAGHLSTGPGDVDVTPERLHPAFHASYDWHSSVHMQWSGLRLLDRASAPLRDRLTGLLARRLTPQTLQVETAYLRAHPASSGRTAEPGCCGWPRPPGRRATRHGPQRWPGPPRRWSTASSPGSRDSPVRYATACTPTPPSR